MYLKQLFCRGFSTERDHVDKHVLHHQPRGNYSDRASSTRDDRFSREDRGGHKTEAYDDRVHWAEGGGGGGGPTIRGGGGEERHEVGSVLSRDITYQSKQKGKNYCNIIL